MADFNRLREDYKHATFNESDAHPDPFVQFQHWFDQAIASGIREPNAMTLATATPDGQPSARIVLLKGVDPHGFTFFTNYASAKAGDLEVNPRAALVFFWTELERQVRILGHVEKVSREETEEYFQVRPFKSRIGAIASPQSRVIPGREWLEQRVAEVDAQYDEGDNPPPCPDHWGGYRVIPYSLEFWQGRRSRLHDRLRYCKQEGPEQGWSIERLAP